MIASFFGDVVDEADRSIGLRTVQFCLGCWEFDWPGM